MDKRTRERREDEYVSGAAGGAIHGGGKLALKLPAGTKVFKPQIDKTYLGDIIPYKCSGGNPVKQAVKGKRYFERTYYVHNMVGPNRAVVLCNARNFNEKCYICDKGAKFVQEHPGDWDEATKKEFKRFKTSDRQAFNWRDRNDKKAGVQFFDISYAMFGQFLNNKLNAAAKKGDKQREFFYRPGKKDGFSLELTVTGKKIETSTTPEISTIEFEPRKADIPQEVLDAAIDLDELVRDSKLSYKEVKELWEGGASDDDDDTDEEDEDGEEDDDDDSDEDGDEDDDGEDEGDEEEDEDDTEEEESDIAVKDIVKYTKDGKKFSGRVQAIKSGRAKVLTKSGKTHVVELDDCTVIADESKNKPKPKKKRPKDDDDFEDDEFDDDEDVDLPPPKRGKKTEKKGGKKTGKKSKPAGDEDEIDF